MAPVRPFGLTTLYLRYLVLHSAAEQIHGRRLLALAAPQLGSLGVTNNITQRKLIRWIKEGFAEFAQHLASANKENVPPLQRKDTTARELPKRAPKTLCIRE